MDQLLPLGKQTVNTGAGDLAIVPEASETLAAVITLELLSDTIMTMSGLCGQCPSCLHIKNVRGHLGGSAS